MPGTTHPSELPTAVSSDDLEDVLAPDMTDDEAARARPIREAPAGLRAALPKNKGGRPRVADPKVQVSLRLDPDVLAAYRDSGPGWQSRVNDVLRAGMEKGVA